MPGQRCRGESMKVKSARYLLNPLSLALLYLCFGILWVIYSDRLLNKILFSADLITEYQTYKGLVFVLLSALIFIFLIYANEKVSAKLESEKQKLSRLAAASPAGIIFTDAEGVIKNLNPEAERILGLQHMDYAFHKFSSLDVKFAAAEGGRSSEPSFFIDEVIRSRKKVRDAAYKVTAKGEEKYITVNAYPIIDDKDEIQGVVGLLIDVTQSVKSKKEALEHRERYELLVDQSPFSVIIYEDNLIRFANRIAVRLFEAESPEQMEGMNIYDAIHPDYTEAVRRRQQKIFNREKLDYPFVIEIVNMKGNVIPAELITIPFKKDDTYAVQLILMDIRERLKHEKETEANLREKNLMLSEIHHRVNNNLALISGLMQLKAFETKNKDAKGVLMENVARIESLAFIYEVIYKSESFADIRIDEAVKRIAANIEENYSGTKNVHTVFELSSLTLNINQAVPFSLLMNELFLNMYTYAARAGRKVSCLTKIETAGEASARISLNIENAPQIMELVRNDRDKLNIRLIELMAEQLRGQLQLKETGPDFSFILEFKRENSTRGSAGNVLDFS